MKKRGGTVCVLAPNAPELFELHFAVPMIRAVRNTLNTRLKPETSAYISDHADTCLVIFDLRL
ncbi:MAG: AMP-binding protein [Pseudomonadota bacterium]